MTTGSTTTPRAAAQQLPRFAKRLGAVSLLALALLFVRPSEPPGAQGSVPGHSVLGPAPFGRPAFTVATLVAREPIEGSLPAAHPSTSFRYVPLLDLERGGLT